MFKLTNDEFEKARKLQARIDKKTAAANQISLKILNECLHAGSERRKAEYSRDQFKRSMIVLEMALEPKLGLEK